MACEIRCWQLPCRHSEPKDIKCSLAGNPSHIHNIVSISSSPSSPQPACTICNPPAPLTERQWADLPQQLAYRQLPAPRSVNSVYRGLDDGMPAEETSAGEVEHRPISRVATPATGNGHHIGPNGQEHRAEVPFEAGFGFQRQHIDTLMPRIHGDVRRERGGYQMGTLMPSSRSSTPAGDGGAVQGPVRGPRSLVDVRNVSVRRGRRERERE